MLCDLPTSFFFFFNDTATTEIYTLSLHDALPILRKALELSMTAHPALAATGANSLEMLLPALNRARSMPAKDSRSEEHTSELQSRSDLVCRLLLEKKKITSAIPLLHPTAPACRDS